MPTLHKRINFSASELGIEIERLLQNMMHDVKYNTTSSYSPNAELYPDNLVPFNAKHMLYLGAHPDVNARDYVSNLRLKTLLR